jgi:hypothetical protein
MSLLSEIANCVISTTNNILGHDCPAHSRRETLVSFRAKKLVSFLNLISTQSGWAD